MQIDVIKRLEDLKSIKDDWNLLFNRRRYSAFQSFYFSYYSWKKELSIDKRNKLSVVIIRKKEPIAIFPFYLDKKRRLRVINDIHCDFCDCLLEEPFDFNIIINTLRDNFNIKYVSLINLKKNSFLLNSLKLMSNYLLISGSDYNYSYLNLEKGHFPNNKTDYRSKQISEFRRIEKKHNNKKHRILNVVDSAFPFQEILLLREEMIALGTRKKDFLPESQIALLLSLYNSKNLILSVIYHNSKINAISFILVRSYEYLFWIDMFNDKKMINIFNYISLIRYYSNKKNIKLNFGRGIYDYKLQNFLPEIAPLFYCNIFFNKFDRLFHLSLTIVKNFLKFTYKRLKT